MRYNVILTVTALLLVSGAAEAQKVDPGTSVTSDPARSSAKNGLGATTTGQSRSGSGTSSSGGLDHNSDQGRDAMPDSNMNIKPRDEQEKGRRR